MGGVVVTSVLPAGEVDRIRIHHPVVGWTEQMVMPRHRLLDAVKDASGLLCMLTDRIDAELLDQAPQLRVVSQMAVGVDNIDLSSCTQRGIKVGHTPDVLTETTADTAMALLLASIRRIPEGRDHVRQGRWLPWQPDLLLGSDLHGSTVGIVGLGRIGAAVARRCAGFDCRLLYTGPRRKLELETALGVSYRSLDDLLGESDHVVLTVPLSDATRQLIDAAALSRMRPTARLVNVSRGGLVDQAALAEALATGVISAAALDVTDPEPIPSDDPLLTMDNCLVIPHLGSASVATRRAMAALAVDNLLEGLAGRPLLAQANP
jgi:glyoxylate reductase